MNFVEFLFERSRGDDGDFIAGAKGISTLGNLREKVERLSRRIAWQYGSGKELLVLSGNDRFFAPGMPLNSSNKIDKVRIREMLSRGEIHVR